jgi:hypothetical protein
LQDLLRTTYVQLLWVSIVITRIPWFAGSLTHNIRTAPLQSLHCYNTDPLISRISRASFPRTRFPVPRSRFASLFRLHSADRSSEKADPRSRKSGKSQELLFRYMPEPVLWKSIGTLDESQTFVQSVKTLDESVTFIQRLLRLSTKWEFGKILSSQFH